MTRTRPTTPRPRRSASLIRPRRLVFADYQYVAKTGPLPFQAEFVTEFTVTPHAEGAVLRVVQDGFPCDERRRRVLCRLRPRLEGHLRGHPAISWRVRNRQRQGESQGVNSGGASPTSSPPMLAPITVRYCSGPRRRSRPGRSPTCSASPSTSRRTPSPRTSRSNPPRRPRALHRPERVGKSSLLRAAAATRCGRRWHSRLPDVPLIDALPGPVDDRLATLAGCGLGEARLLLRTPAELSEGQRYRFRLAYRLARRLAASSPADEFTATLDRTLAKVVAFNLRKLVARPASASSPRRRTRTSSRT